MITDEAKKILEKYIKNIGRKTNENIIIALLRLAKGLTLQTLGGGTVRIGREMEIERIDAELIMFKQGDMPYFVLLDNLMATLDSQNVDTKYEEGDIVELQSPSRLSTAVNFSPSYAHIGDRSYKVVGNNGGVYLPGVFINTMVDKAFGYYITLGGEVFLVPPHIIKGKSKKYTCLAGVEMGMFLDKYILNYKDIKRRKVNSIKSRYSDIAQQFLSIGRTLNDALCELNGVEKEEEIQAKLMEELTRIASYPTIRDIAIVKDAIEIETEWIYMKYNGEEHNIGRFIIYINFIDNYIRVKNKYAVDSYPHPHIDEEGELCQGGFATIISKCFSEFNILGLIDVMLEFLPAYDPNSPYQSMDRFLELNGDLFIEEKVNEEKEQRGKPVEEPSVDSEDKQPKDSKPSDEF